MPRHAGPASSQVDWKKWGEVDPLFGVASWPGKRRGEAAPWTDDEFFELGRQDWEDFLALWQQYGVGTGTCVEIGCGAGRITRHLASRFERVEGVDVAEGMIAYARQRITDPHVTLHVTDGLALPLPDRSADAVFSTHVFQHLDSHEQAAAYFTEMSRIMKPGATLMVHLPIHDWPLLPKPLTALYRLRRTMGDARAYLTSRLVAEGRIPPAIRGLSFPVDWVFATLAATGLESVQITVMAVSSNGGLHPFAFARKPS